MKQEERNTFEQTPTRPTSANGIDNNLNDILRWEECDNMKNCFSLSSRKQYYCWMALYSLRRDVTTHHCL